MILHDPALLPNTSVLHCADLTNLSKTLTDHHLLNAVHISATQSLTQRLYRYIDAQSHLLTQDNLIKRLKGSNHQCFQRDVKLLSHLEEVLREAAERAGEQEGAHALWRGRSALLKTISKLIESGFTPDELTLAPHEGPEHITTKALSAWRSLLKVAPKLMRELDLWGEMDASKLERALRAELDEHSWALEGSTLVFHGYIFYTPTQWRCFKRLAEAGAHCVFLVHDDGVSQALSVWRSFFSPPHTPLTPAPLSRSAQALSDALRGQRVSIDERDLTIKSYRNMGALLRSEELRSAIKSYTPKDPWSLSLYSAEITEMRRHIKLTSYEEAHRQADLASLPAGQLLLALHDAVKVDLEQGVSFHLTHEIVRDALASHFCGEEVTRVYARVHAYFEGCSTPEEWVKRAEELLEFTYEAEPKHKKTWNMLHALPWGQLKPQKAKKLVDALRKLSEHLNSLFGAQVNHQARDINEQLKLMRTLLEKGLTLIPEGERERVERMLNELYDPQRPQEELKVSLMTLLDVIRGLLGQTGEAELIEEEEQVDQSGAVAGLSALDHFIVASRRERLHVMMLGDLSFPGSMDKRVSVWPFHLEHLTPQEGTEAYIGLELFKALKDSAMRVDLYRLHLALNSQRTEGPEGVTLSWVDEWNGSVMGPSPFLRLLMNLKVRGEDLNVGGVPASAHADELCRGPLSALIDVYEPKQATTLHIHNEHWGAERLCPRRFMYQWVTGHGPAHPERYRLSSLFGNLKHALERFYQMDPQIAHQALPFLGEVERASSIQRASIKLDGATANGKWPLFMLGNRKGLSPWDEAYQRTRPAPGQRSDFEWTVNPQSLPDGIFHPPGPESIERDEHRICRLCPLQDECVLGHAKEDAL